MIDAVVRVAMSKQADHQFSLTFVVVITQHELVLLPEIGT